MHGAGATGSRVTSHVKPNEKPRPARDGVSLRFEAGEGGRTLDIHVGNVTLYH